MRIKILIILIVVLWNGLVTGLDQNGLVKDFNSVRERFSNKKNVTYYELILNQTLCDLAEKSEGSPDTWNGVYSDYRWTSLNGSQGARFFVPIIHIYNNHTQQELWEIKIAGRNSSIPALEHYVPKQKFICCVEKIIDDRDVICLLGPEGALDSWDASSMIFECDVGYEMKGYFCVLIRPTTVSPSTVSSTTTTEVTTTSESISTSQGSTSSLDYTASTEKSDPKTSEHFDYSEYLEEELFDDNELRMEFDENEEYGYDERYWTDPIKSSSFSRFSLLVVIMLLTFSQIIK